MRFRWLKVTIFCGAVLCALVYGGWAVLGQGRSSAAGVLSDPLETAKVGHGPSTAGSSRVAGRGRVETATEELDLAIGVMGTLGVVFVNEGDSVNKDQILAELVNGDQRARVIRLQTVHSKVERFGPLFRALIWVLNVRPYLDALAMRDSH